jgi:hypothetical protein
MKEPLFDYSGDFAPEFRWDKLSKDGLAGLLAAYSNYIRKIDGHWYLSVMNKCGNDVAYDCDIDVWNKLMKFELKVASDMMNIRGDGIESVAKYFQVSPWFWTFNPRLDLKGDDCLEVTFAKCPTLLALEKEGSGREEQICRVMEPELFETIAHHFNPKMKVAALKLPPRRSVDDICCKWQFKIERKV